MFVAEISFLGLIACLFAIFAFPYVIVAFLMFAIGIWVGNSLGTDPMWPTLINFCLLLWFIRYRRKVKISKHAKHRKHKQKIKQAKSYNTEAANISNRRKRYDIRKIEQGRKRSCI